MFLLSAGPRQESAGKLDWPFGGLARFFCFSRSCFYPILVCRQGDGLQGASSGGDLSLSLPPSPLRGNLRPHGMSVGCCIGDLVCEASSLLLPHSSFYLRQPPPPAFSFSSLATTGGKMSDALSQKTTDAEMCAAFLDEAELVSDVIPLLDSHARKLCCIRCALDDFQEPGVKGWGVR